MPHYTDGSLAATFTTSVPGLVPAPGAGSNRFLREDGTWQTVSAGSVSFPLRGSDGSVTAPTYSFSATTNLGFYKFDTNIMAFCVDGEDVMLIGDAYVEHPQQERATGQINPDLTSDQENWSPAGITFCSIITVAMTNPDGIVRSIGGISNPAPGRRISIFNRGNISITFKHESASSTGANRLILPGLSNMTLGGGAGVRFWYDGQVLRWRCESRT